MSTQYIGENLWAGHSGKILIIAGLLFTILAALAYLKATRKNNTLSEKWNRNADFLFSLHSAVMFIAAIILFYLLINRHYEYKYVWIHTENSLGLEYLVASFWAGQEGSLLFWVICQAVFGLLIIRFAGNWKPNVMFIISLSQAFMTSMLLGISVLGIQVGMSPFTLLREATENIGNAFFENPNYLQLITDGNGLNPLLRNFWMLSHPPVLFIGFAAALVPFSYAISGLWTKKYHDWIKPALPWMLAAILFLGAGIILGGVWAYESLTFGGFWAWDPIENASLVPWLILIAALHLMIVAVKQKNTYLPLFIFTVLSFAFVIYSTFLTRSGILADTSVHSFGDDGMGLHIFIYILAICVSGAFFIIKNIKNLPPDKKTNLFSKEFWLFAASLIIMLSSFQIIFTTSLPVINKIAGANFAPPVDVVSHYNKWQAPFAAAIALMIGIGNYLKWNNNNIKGFLLSSWFAIALSVVIFIVTMFLYPISNVVYQVMLLFSYYAFFSSLDNILRFKEKHISAGGAISHIGIALFLAAAILTFSKQEVISKNTSGYSLGSGFSEQENLLLIKNKPLPLDDYHVIYKGYDFDGERLFYQVDFLKKNKKGEFYKKFSSFPSVLLNEKMGNVYEPYAKIYPFKDIFTYITYAEIDKDASNDSHKHLGKTEITLNDTIGINNDFLVFHDLTAKSDDAENKSTIVITAHLKNLTHFGQKHTFFPKYELKNGRIIFHDDYSDDLSLYIGISNISDEPNTIEISVYEEREEFIVIKTIVFPFINLLWLSLIVILAGLFIAMKKRWKTRNVTN